jgi:hypothetical protein
MQPSAQGSKERERNRDERAHEIVCITEDSCKYEVGRKRARLAIFLRLHEELESRQTRLHRIELIASLVGGVGAPTAGCEMDGNAG